MTTMIAGSSLYVEVKMSLSTLLSPASLDNVRDHNSRGKGLLRRRYPDPSINPLGTILGHCHPLLIHPSSRSWFIVSLSHLPLQSFLIHCVPFSFTFAVVLDQLCPFLIFLCSRSNFIVTLIHHFTRSWSPADVTYCCPPLASSVLESLKPSNNTPPPDLYWLQETGRKYGRNVL